MIEEYLNTQGYMLFDGPLAHIMHSAMQRIKSRVKWQI